MEKRLNRNLSGGSVGSIRLQKQIAESRRTSREAHENNGPAPDLTDFMNDMFFGTSNPVDKKAYNLTGKDQLLRVIEREKDEEDDFDSSTRSVSSRMTQEWLEEAKRMVAFSPSRSRPNCESPSRLVGSPRFASAQASLSTLSAIDKRDPLSRSARRHRAVEGFSGEILSKTSKHNRNKSEPLKEEPPPPAGADKSPVSAVQKWFTNILKPPNTHNPQPISPDSDPSTAPTHTLPPRESPNRRSRFQSDPNACPATHRHTFKVTAGSCVAVVENPFLSPPKHLTESAHRRSISSSTCSRPENPVLSPPRNLVESAHRRSISSSTCTINRITQKPNFSGELKDSDFSGLDINGFLKEQRLKVGRISSGEINRKANIVLSGPSNSMSSMVAAICYAWLLENRMKAQEEEDGSGFVVVPLISIRRAKMWRHPQAAWLFHHVGLDAPSLLFSDEVDLETLMMAEQLNVLVVGQDILKTNGEVGSLCTILTDNYCEDAYDLLQTAVVKKLLLAGILLDTQNLNASTQLSMTRDAEAVQLLSVGSAPNYRSDFYDQLMKDHRDCNFLEASRHNYGKPLHESSNNSRSLVDQRKSGSRSYNEAIIANLDKKATDAKNTSMDLRNSDKNSNDIKNTATNLVPPHSRKPVSLPTQVAEAAPQPTVEASRGKNKFFLARWFGFGSK